MKRIGKAKIVGGKIAVSKAVMGALRAELARMGINPATLRNVRELAEGESR